jgi:cyanophycinase
MAVFALLGSGEFEPWAREVDRWCAERATSPTDRAIVLPTASAPEGDDVFDRWAGMGAEHYSSIGLAPMVLPLKTRADASRPEIVDEVADARIIFFSGGNPGYLANTVRDTPFWEAVLDAIAHGTAFGGCSAGATAVGSIAPDVTSSTINPADIEYVPGAPLFTRGFIPTHFDAIDSFFPGLRQMILDARPPDQVLFGVDENTAACGDGKSWTVIGSRAVTVVDPASPELVEHFAGSTITCDIGLTLGSRF